MLKVTITTGSYKTHGAPAGAMKASLSLKSGMKKVFAVLTIMEFTGQPGTSIHELSKDMILIRY